MINKSSFETEQEAIIEKEKPLISDEDYSEVVEVSDLKQGFTIRVGSKKVSVVELCDLLMMLKYNLFNNDYKREPSYTG